MIREDVRFYCGLAGEQDWNHHPMRPGPYTCIAPVYGRTVQTKRTNKTAVPKDTAVLMDSGAFSDRLGDRLSFEKAMRRQIAHAYTFDYVDQVTHVASYDLLIDEKWQDGERSKIRWSKDEAEFAVKETVAAALYIVSQRKRLREIFGHSVGLALSSQGVEVKQYLRCAEKIVPLMDKQHDLFGLGGWCITGLMPDIILPSFMEIMDEVIPFLGSQQVAKVHIWGMIFPEGLAYLLNLCDQEGIKLSTDSAGPAIGPCRPSWGYGSWRDATYKMPPILVSCKNKDEQGDKAPICVSGTRCRGLERCLHVKLTREYLECLRDREPMFYKAPSKTRYKQLRMEEAV